MSDSPGGMPQGPESDAPEDSPELEPDPIDVRELLESTKKLFEPADIQRALEQGGYTEEGATTGSHVVAAEDDPRTAVRDGKPEVDGATNTPWPLPITASSTDDNSEMVPQPAAEVTRDDQGATEADSDGAQDVNETATRRGLNVLSVVAMILVVALSPLAVIFGYIALGQLRRANQRGEALALWAIGLGWVVLALWSVLIGALIWIGWQEGITVDALSELIELFTLP